MLTGYIPMKTGGAIVVVIITAVIALFSICATVTSVFSHSEELGNLVRYRKDVKSAQEFLTAAKKHVKTVTDIAEKVDVALLVKADVDHPIVKAMQALNSAEGKLCETKEKLNRAEGNIEARKSGPFSWVVSLYGDGQKA